MPRVHVAELLEPATHRLVRAVDAMTDEQWTEPSLLPGWTRAHVVAHLTLNAEALGTALEGVREGRPTPMYPSQEARDADVVTLGDGSPAELRERFLASTTVIARSVDELADNLADVTFPRVPGAPSGIRAGAVADMRLREVEVHHVDLALAYTASDWSPDFATLLLDARTTLPRPEPGFTAYAVDLDRSWRFGVPEATGGVTVSGTVVALAWWATGRDSGAELTSDGGTVPLIGPW